MTTSTAQEPASNVIAATNDQASPGTLDSILVTYDTRVTRKDAEAERKALSWIVEQIRTSPDLQESVEIIRAQPSSDRRHELKKKLLPYFTFFQFSNNIRKKEFFQRVKFILMDLDHVSGRMDELRGKMRQDPEIFMFFVSPNGDGLKIVFALDRDITSEAEYKPVYQRFRALIKERYGVETDDIKDVARACYLSYDPDLFVNHSASVSSVSAGEQTAPPSIPQTLNGDILSAFNGSTSPGRTAALTRVLGYLNRAGVQEDIAVNLCISWNRTKNTPPLDDGKVQSTVHNIYRRYDTQSRATSVRFQEVNNCYYKVSGNGTAFSQKLTATFCIAPKELLVLQDRDCLKCDVTSAQGHTYTDILIENNDWLSKSKLLSAIGHSDCTFLSSDTDVQGLCSHIIGQVPVRKIGTKMIGLHSDVWAIEGMNIASSGILPDLRVVPFDKGTDAFYRGISYETMNDADYSEFLSQFYGNIMSINNPNVILPWLAWIYVAPVKERLRKILGGFPLVFVHGGQGSGKTSTATQIMRLCGYRNPIPYSCTIRTFPMLKTLTSTNGIPVVLDEFKKSNMTNEEVDNVLRVMRRNYSGEIETKGHADQTVENYELLAPLVVMGEWDISQPATKERVLVARFTGEVKKNRDMQEAFAALKQLPLESFMPRYIQFVLSQDLGAILECARGIILEHFRGKQIAPRVFDNLCVMLVGVELLIRYGQKQDIHVPCIDYSALIRTQLKEITGSGDGFVRSAVDQLIEELGIMWTKKYKSISPGYAEDKWWDVKELPVGVNREKRKVIAIHFERAFPEFKEYARRTSYEGELLDSASYKKLFADTEYITDVSRAVGLQGKTYKCVCIDIEGAEKAGVDLVGFITRDYQEITDCGNEAESEKE